MSIKTEKIKYVAYDADDTLWANEPIFVDIQERCASLLAPYLAEGLDFEAELYARERENLRLFGYGVKGFILSVLETCIQISDFRLTAHEVQQIIDWGKEMLQHPVTLLPDVSYSIDALENYYRLLVITKGDLFDQENKLARSGLADRFWRVEIISEKNPESYQQVLNQHGIQAEEFIMLGNSLKSDILPVLQIGGQAIHIPAKQNWVHEQVSERALEGYRYEQAPLKVATEWLLAGRPFI